MRRDPAGKSTPVLHPAIQQVLLSTYPVPGTEPGAKIIQTTSQLRHAGGSQQGQQKTTDFAPIQAEPGTGAGREGEHLGPPPAGWSLPTVLAPLESSQGQ